MKTAKKSLAVLMCILMIFSFSSVAFAENDVTPVIVVSGMNSYPLYNAESEGNEEVWPPSGKNIVGVVGKVIAPLSAALLSGNWSLADECYKKVYDDLFEIVSCDENGDSLHDITALSFPFSVSNYPQVLEHENDEDEQGIAKTLAAALGAENVYYFNYDWRLDPLETADLLRSYIENVKALAKSDKVTLVPCSMGGVITNSYLYKYGSEDIEKIVYCLVASKGIDLVGELFTGKLTVTTDALLERLFSFERGELLTQTLLSVLQTGVEITPALSKAVDAFVEYVLSGTSEKAYDEVLSVSFASMPGMWSFCPDKDYEAAKSIMFSTGCEKAFEERIDEYHYNVQNKAETLMTDAKNSGTEIYVTASYGYVGFPVAEAAWEQSDCLIETKNESFGAVCARYGENLGDDYVAASTVCADSQHLHLSTDGIIDASSCLFPEQTWFIKYMKHVGFPVGTQASELLLWLVESEKPLSVNDEDGYPQFTALNNTTGKLTSLTGGEVRHSVLDEHSSVLSRALEFLLNLRSLILNLVEQIKNK